MADLKQSLSKALGTPQSTTGMSTRPPSSASTRGRCPPAHRQSVDALTVNSSHSTATQSPSSTATSSLLGRLLIPVIQSRAFNNIILLVIVCNTAVIALQSTVYIRNNYGWYLDLIDNSLLGVYMTEAALKLMAFGRSYFRSYWNVFDFVIVAVSFVSNLLPGLVVGNTHNFTQILRLLRIFRALRSLRVLRTVAFFESLQLVVKTFLNSIPAMTSIGVLSLLVLWRTLYGPIDPARFGTIPRALFCLFSVLTLNNWSDIWHTNMQQDSTIFIYLFVFILLEAFIFLNLFVAVIVTNLASSYRSKFARRLREETKAGSIPMRLEDSKHRMAAETTTHKGDNVANALFGGGGGDNGDVSHYYPPNMPIRQKELVAEYLRLLATLDYSRLVYERQNSMLSDLVELLTQERPQDQQKHRRVAGDIRSEIDP
ncbi:Cation channel sperm-associated protein 1 [Sorochytrium milnesiophthora]